MSDLLLNLRTFIRVAERLNFSSVANEMFASHTTVARRIDQLEEHFRTQLLHRSTRRLQLTSEGVRLLEHARMVMEGIKHAEADLSGAANAQGVVRVGVTTALGLHYADRLPILRDRHPDLRVEFAVADWQDDMAASGLDMALHVGRPQAEQDSILALGLIQRVLVASPGYLKAKGSPATPYDLDRHDCITYGYGPTRAVWTLSGEPIHIAGPFRANSSEAVFRAVLSGIGIGLLPLIQVGGDVKAGRLVRVLPETMIEPLALFVSHRFEGVRLPTRVRAMIDFLVTEFPDDSLMPAANGLAVRG